MDLFTFMGIISETRRCIKWMRENGILKKAKYCQDCNTWCSQIKMNNVDGCIFRCSRCRKKHSIRQDSFFSASHLELKVILVIIYMFLIDVSQKTVGQFLPDLSCKTMVDWFSLCRDICSWKILKDDYQLGEGNGEIVEIDESKFGRKRKYNKGAIRNGDGTWIFGMIERIRSKVFIFTVENRTREILQPFITAHVKPGSTIHSDQFATYCNLNDLGFDHKTVNHSIEFVNADGIHTNTIEGFWGNSKNHFKNMRGVHRSQQGPHLDEIMYKWNYKGSNLLNTFFHDITGKFHVNHDLTKDSVKLATMPEYVFR